MSTESDTNRLVLDHLCQSPGIGKKLAALANASPRRPTTFPGIDEAGQAALLAVLARELDARLWFVCSRVKHQEILYSEFLNWNEFPLLLPELEMAAIEGATVDSEIVAERLDVLQRIGRTAGKEPVFITESSLEESVPSAESINALRTRVRRGEDCQLETLIQQLTEAGYERCPQVSARLQFAVRGGIVDIFSLQHPLPVRLEFFGDTVDSIREFDLDQQTSVSQLDWCEFLLGDPESTTQTLDQFIAKDDILVAIDCECDRASILISRETDQVPGTELADCEVVEAQIGGFGAGDFVLQEASRQRLIDQLSEWQRLDWNLHILCSNDGEEERLKELLTESGGDIRDIRFDRGFLTRGFIVPSACLAVLSESALFGRYRTSAARRLDQRRMRLQARRTQIDFSELGEGDYVVHLEHGIARYQGLRTLPGDGMPDQDVLELEFAEGARLYVPLEHAYLVSRYVGVGKRNPSLSKLGEARWQRARKAAEKAVYDYAANLLAIHAERETAKGYAFHPDTKWQLEFEQSFPYKETPDQLTSIQAAKIDMESERPMDRLICGDVGFGKTEVAIRAAFKAVMGGKQVAVLVPTTVLAQQHEQTFRERMSEYPVTIDGLSRFKTRGQQREVLTGLKEGTIDIVIGTHRLISKDVSFHNLGLVVVDEEQRFGVLHKEKFKTLFRLIDVLTLSATPIPRTLYLSLMGARDMSVIETPPPNRLPVETVICGFDERVIRDSIRRELKRDGQVYFLHNRVKSIENMRKRILHLCPEARIDVGHGQMDEHELEKVMQRFVSGETNVLISTTIIESGLDIPNANTIIIDRADRFGLADLYQLRGRVGRAQHKAYAILLLPRDMMTVGEARKRISAIRQYSALGAGFKIAMRDLEIRGAGNVLGTAQSGHIVAVGFDLYCQLLKQAVARLKGDKVTPRLEVIVHIDLLVTNEGEFSKDGSAARIGAYLPASYIEEPRQRIQAYRQLSEASSLPTLRELQKQWKDRYGPLPKESKMLVLVQEIRLAAAHHQITKLEVKDHKLMLTRGGSYIMVDGRFPRLTAEGPERNVRLILSLLKNL